MVTRLIRRLAHGVMKRIRGGKPAPSNPSHSPSVQKEQARVHRREPSGGRRPPPAVREKTWSPDQFQVPPKEGHARFHDFGLSEQIMHAVHDLGFKYCTPIQAKVLSHLSGNPDIAGKAQTGTGKTAAFLMAIFGRFLSEPGESRERKPRTPRALVLAPTRELVVQIVKDAHELGKYCPFKTMAVFGGMDFEKQRRELESGVVDTVVATPGRLLDFLRRGVLNLKSVKVLVIDEADRMLDMGFIPDVSSIVRATPPKDQRQTMLFSATLTEDVLRLASRWMTDPVFCEMDPEHVAVNTVKQIVYVVTTSEKFVLLCNLLKNPEMKRVLIFGNRRDSTQHLVDRLHRHGIQCDYLSGTVAQEKRLKVLDAFRAGRTRIVVATDVAGRGLHVEGVSHVINYEFPYEPEDYVHRIGRTGRAGFSGTAMSFACEEESFVIPEIEKYIGEPLKCSVPEPELLAPCPPSDHRRGHSR